MVHRLLAVALFAMVALVHAAPNPNPSASPSAAAESKPPAPSVTPAGSIKPVSNVGAGTPMMINTPTTVLECQPVQFTWTGGLGPYYLTIIPGDQPFAPPMRRFPTQNGTSFTWNADLPAGTKFNLLLRDSTGAQAYSATVAEQEGNDKSCEKPITVVPQPGATSATPAASGIVNAASNAADHPTPTASLITASATAHRASSAAMRAIGAQIHGIELLWVFTMGIVGVLLL